MKKHEQIRYIHLISLRDKVSDSLKDQLGGALWYDLKSDIPEYLGYWLFRQLWEHNEET